MHVDASLIDARHAVSASVNALAAAAAADRELAQEERESLLGYFDVADSRVCHVGVYAALTNPGWAGACATADCVVRFRRN